ncbi:kinesin-like protein KIF20B isoform X1 [Parambassis ranga]|uniref:Kinesin-like protein KIF20B isoform X1 n=1 Tax=Parambassis ranga TaxID=210632 RepID=A0A6P7JSR5_9TELE|nr:kinesin-like protein KIF20B isoform X1 [Parambassis ranga]
MTATPAEDKISLEVEANTKFSVWVSFCEIYKENIHDLLEVVPSGAMRRTALRLSQDVKGNAFVKDLRWVQVNSAEEAYKVMKLGKKNQSFSATKLNHLSSRSHSIFSIRILRIEDGGTPRVCAVSELCLCDLAGSERCAKTQNKGERLKEAGNINTSLLILGKCINALRHNQQAKLLQHIPFRESKLTHYLQGFFCGRGKACMIVNINQCASMYDETLNVLKFSAVAQKVVILSSRPQMSTSEFSFTLSNADRRVRRTSSLIGWESSLGDVQEDDGEEDMSLMEDTMNQTGNEEDTFLISKKRQVAVLQQLRVQLKNERAENMLMEAQIREEISREFSELFSEMQNDYSERLARERDILEERAERRLEIFKNLIDKMDTSGQGQHTQAMEKCLDSFPTEFSVSKNFTEADHTCPNPVRGRPPAEGNDAGGGLEMNTEKQTPEDQLAHKSNGETIVVEEEEMKSLLCKLQEKSLEVAQLKKHMDDLQKMVELPSQSHSLLMDKRSSHEREVLQEALAALEKEKKAREDTVAALEYQTNGKEEVLASLEQEKKAREEAIAALVQLKQSKEGMQAMLDAERKDEDKALPQKVRDLTERLKAAEQQEASATKMDEHSKEIQEKSSLVHTLMQEVQRLKQELQTSTVSTGEFDNQLQKEVSELKKNLTDERGKNDSIQSQKLELEHELAEIKQHLSQKQLIFDQQEKQFTEKMNRKEAALVEQIAELRKKLPDQEETRQSLDELRHQLYNQKQASEEVVEKLKAELEEQTQASEKQVEQLNEKLQDQEVSLTQQLEELKNNLREQEATSNKLTDDLRQKLREQEHTAELLKSHLEEAKASVSSTISEAEDLKRLNCDLQNEVASLREKVSNMEESDKSSRNAYAPTLEMETLLKEKDRQVEEKVAELEKASERRGAEMQEKLLEKEALITSLQNSLQKAQEQREDEECQAVQEARHKEVERRRELLAVAHEAIAQKDAELNKKAEEINRLKDIAKQDTEKVKNLSVDLQRKEDDTSDLREKMADYKKQIQQVQKEISTMREEEKVLRQKLTDMEKSKKQLQSDISSRDRTIQQLKVEQSSHAKSDETLQLYQKACEDIEAKDRVMQDMRLALSEQEVTQEEMEQVLEEKLNVIQELSSEVEKLKGMLLDCGKDTQCDSSSDELKLAKEQTAQALESLKTSTEKNQAERRKWLEEKQSLIGQAKEAENKRNQEMRKFAEDRERYIRQQNQLESQLAEKEQTMETWRKDRDTLVSALEVQLKKLLSSQAEKDKLIQQLSHKNTLPPQEDGSFDHRMVDLQADLTEKEAEILRLREELKASKQRDTVSQANTRDNESLTATVAKSKIGVNTRQSQGMEARASVSSQGSAGCPSVLDSSEISTENGRTSRFPRPELEISFSPLQPNRMALRRQGEESTVTVKITRSARKRKSEDMEKSHIFRRSKRRTHKEEVEAENRRNTRTKMMTRLTAHKEESSSPAGRYNSQSSILSKKEGTLQKIGDFLQSSPTLLGTKAKKMMSLVSGRGEVDSAASSSSPSLSQRAKRNKSKRYRPEISSPIDMPSHPIISRKPEEKESDHQIIKRHLRSRKAK